MAQLNLTPDAVYDALSTSDHSHTGNLQAAEFRRVLFKGLGLELSREIVGHIVKGLDPRGHGRINYAHFVVRLSRARRLREESNAADASAAGGHDAGDGGGATPPGSPSSGTTIRLDRNGSVEISTAPRADLFTTQSEPQFQGAESSMQSMGGAVGAVGATAGDYGGRGNERQRGGRGGGEHALPNVAASASTYSLHPPTHGGGGGGGGGDHPSSQSTDGPAGLPLSSAGGGFHSLEEAAAAVAQEKATAEARSIRVLDILRQKDGEIRQARADMEEWKAAAEAARDAQGTGATATALGEALEHIRAGQVERARVSAMQTMQVRATRQSYPSEPPASRCRATPAPPVSFPTPHRLIIPLASSTPLRDDT